MERKFKYIFKVRETVVEVPSAESDADAKAESGFIALDMYGTIDRIRIKMVNKLIKEDKIELLSKENLNPELKERFREERPRLR